MPANQKQHSSNNEGHEHHTKLRHTLLYCTVVLRCAVVYCTVLCYAVSLHETRKQHLTVHFPASGKLLQTVDNGTERPSQVAAIMETGISGMASTMSSATERSATT